jgi:hypothetical protein
MIDIKEWKYTFFYSGESTINDLVHLGAWDSSHNEYNVILKGSRSYKNIIHFPFFVYYQIFDSINFRLLDKTSKNINIPTKFCCTIITNDKGLVRNKFIEKLEKYKEIDHYGKYKNNQIDVISGNWHSPELIKKISEYKFIICFENSEDDAYITEKIINPFLANIIPIYWGNNRIGDYFNIDRILHLKDQSEIMMDKLIKKIIDIDNDDSKYINILNEPFHTILNVEINMTTISNDIQKVLFNNNYEKIQKVICIVDKDKEPERYNRIKYELNNKEFKHFLIECSLPTYHDNIDQRLFNKIKINQDKHFKSFNKELSLREISLFLNFYIIFKRILGYYKEGFFMIVESDIIFKSDFNLMYSLLEKININHHHCIAFGSGCNLEIIPTNKSINFIELHKKKETRCTDSFIFSYAGIQLFAKYIEDKIMTKGIDNPIDFFMNEFLNTNTYNMYWTSPSITYQGSQKGIFKSTIQES